MSKHNMEDKFPLLSIEEGCILSKQADITLAFEIDLPELFTLTSKDYEAMHSAWHKAIKVLPQYTIVHKQDWFIEYNRKNEKYKFFHYKKCFQGKTKSVHFSISVQKQFGHQSKGEVLPSASPFM